MIKFSRNTVVGLEKVRNSPPLIFVLLLSLFCYLAEEVAEATLEYNLVSCERPFTLLDFVKSSFLGKPRQNF